MRRGKDDERQPCRKVDFAKDQRDSPPACEHRHQESNHGPERGQHGTEAEQPGERLPFRGPSERGNLRSKGRANDQQREPDQLRALKRNAVQAHLVRRSHRAQHQDICARIDDGQAAKHHEGKQHAGLRARVDPHLVRARAGHVPAQQPPTEHQRQHRGADIERHRLRRVQFRPGYEHQKHQQHYHGERLQQLAGQGRLHHAPQPLQLRADQRQGSGGWNETQRNQIGRQVEGGEPATQGDDQQARDDRQDDGEAGHPPACPHLTCQPGLVAIAMVARHLPHGQRGDAEGRYYAQHRDQRRGKSVLPVGVGSQVPRENQRPGQAQHPLRDTQPANADYGAHHPRLHIAVQAARHAVFDAQAVSIGFFDMAAIRWRGSVSRVQATG